MKSATLQLKKYLVFVEHRCPLGTSEVGVRDGWRCYEAIEPLQIGARLLDRCGGAAHHEWGGVLYPSDSCDTVHCEERGIVTRIEDYSLQRARELGIEQADL
ncbi:MAG: hypothetical protein AABX14_01850 [Candidatus Aenigmatarchaeota archaeon]